MTKKRQTTIRLTDHSIVSGLAEERRQLEHLVGEFKRRQSGSPVYTPTHTIVDLVRRRIAEIDETLKDYGVTVS